MNVNLGFQTGKKYERYLTHDNTTTTDFGFCQPILNRRVHAQDTVNLRFGQIVRLMPMPLPTFGTIDLKTYVRYVAMEDIFHPYASMMSGQSYNGVDGSYIPQKLPNSTVTLLSLFVLSCSDIYAGCQTTIDGNVVFRPLNYTQANYKKLFIAFIKKMTGLDTTLAAEAIFEYLYGGTGNDYCARIKSSNRGYFNKSTEWSSIKTDSNYFDFTSCDFVYGYTWHEGLDEHVWQLGFKLNNIGRSLRKILIGSGYQLTYDSTPVEIVRLFAYYKVWFDLFNPARDKSWKDTAAFHIMEYMEQFGLTTLYDYLNTDLNSADFIQQFFFDELAQCYYTADPDYISAHIVGNRNAIVPGNTLNVQGPAADTQHDVALANSSGHEHDGPHLNISAFGSISQPLLDTLRKMTSLTNIATAIGGRVKEFMRVMFGSDYLDNCESDHIGTQSFPIEAEGVFANAATELAKLADYAGKAVASTQGKEFKYTARAEGYVVALMVAVPRTGYSQGIDGMLEMLDKNSNYQPAYDGITLVPSRKNILYDIVEWINDDDSAEPPVINSFEGGFGNIPIYGATRYAKNVLNGDVSLKSTRESFLPYTLDKLLPYPNFKIDNGYCIQVAGSKVPNSSIVASSLWRYIGKYRWAGNFDRIFYNENRQGVLPDTPVSGYRDMFDDNFIVDNYIDLKIFGYPLPIADTYQTEAFNGDNLAIEKA